MYSKKKHFEPPLWETSHGSGIQPWLIQVNHQESGYVLKVSEPVLCYMPEGFILHA